MEKEKNIKEKELANLPKVIGTKELRILIDLVKDHICKIKCKDGSYGTGFFCYIPIDFGNSLTALLTNNHVLNIDDIKTGQTINFTLDNDDIEYNIFIDNNRRTYTNDSFDITIIEIIKDDKIDEKSFLCLDKQIFEEDSNKIFKNCQIFLLHYPNENEAGISPGIIKSITEDEGKKTILHLCDINEGSSGSPIINKNNFKVIGIHKWASKGDQDCNLGILLKEPIEKFIEEIKLKKENIRNKNIDNNESKNLEMTNSLDQLELDKIIENIISQKNNEENKELNNNDLDKIILKYKIDDIGYFSKDIIIFGEDFVKNNKNICKIILNEKEIELTTYLNININQLKNNNILEIKLKGIKNITNMSSMFSKCKSLTSLPDISNWNTQNVTDMSYMFNNCKSLLFLPDISKWDTQNVTNMSCMFENCKSLSSLPDISKWNTQNVTNMRSMFANCESLSILPDISKWNTQNVENMSSMFCNCKSLLSFPDISIWNILKANDISVMFDNCNALSV